ncbi:hypothetical protein AAFC00_001733 [Neodothiora populina]|uniref:Uncharacterized protein n=1 Tax=Neodothiora populina TaxID=2781224 RepID=A0ABR3PPY9_9PEZI
MDPRDGLQPAIHNSGAASPFASQDDPQTTDAAASTVRADDGVASEPQAPGGRTGGQPAEPEGTTVDGASNDAVVYGTRSRNRSSNARPNYNVDFEDDYDDLVAAPSTKSTVAKIAASTKAVSETKRAATANEPEQSEKSPSDQTATSSNPPRKRKAGGNSSTGVTTPAYVPAANQSRAFNMMTFEKSKVVLKKGALVADDGAVLHVDDHVYLVCEPPGDPYYLCRIMEFLHTNSEDPKSPVDSIRVNWFYRPRDVQRHNSDTRLVYGTMHSDVCPLTSLRGKCQILHRSEIPNLDDYRKGTDCFWYSQIFDRFIRRFYELIPTSEIINVPDKVKKALDERWKYIAVEVGRVKELTSAVKLCKRCSQFCASNDSVDCAICKNSYHMNCVRPPLPKKPTRGFAWACGPCSRAQEKKLEARQTPVLGQATSATEEDEIFEEEEEDPAQLDSTRAPSPSSEIVTDQHPGTQAEIAMAKMWPFRYLGIHCRVEDALQYDDRAIYPRASSRLGPRHQANVNIWHGRPVELVKPADIKKRYVKSSSHKKDGKLSKETLAAIEADRVEKAKRPKWVQDEPPGYVHRGGDYPPDDPRSTAQLLFKMPEGSELSTDIKEDHASPPVVDNAFVDDYVSRAKGLASSIRAAEYGCNFLDKALKLLIDEDFDKEKALQKLAKVDGHKDLKEPVLTEDELKRFEDGVSKYGSEHRSVRLHMKTTLPNSTIVRFYYLWKKTLRGKQIWDHYGGRKGKKRQNMDAAAKMQAQVAHDLDDSAFDTAKAETHKRGFQCKFCSTKHSRQWRRAPGVTPGQTVPADGGKGVKDKGNRLMLALCGRCAGLWRRYAIQYEDLDEATRKAAQNGGRGLKRRIDEELLREVLAAHETPPAGTPEAANVPVPSIESSAEPPKKKSKTAAEDKKKEKAAPPPKLPTPPPPPIIPDEPRWRDLPCAVCKLLDASGELPVSCGHCKMTVHKRCFGLADQVLPAKWICEQCANDRNPVVSTDYACTLCTVEETPQELLEPPRVSHKKKTDREREKERLEKELTEKAKLEYRDRQMELSRPVMPREALKRTDGNNWVHVLCAVWTPEIRFSRASKLERAEGFSAIPIERYEATCKLCKNNKHGSCVSCLQCKANFHVGCAAEAGYTFGFDVTPIKGSRKDQVVTVTLGEENGALTAAIWCKEHTVKTTVHQISEATDDSGSNALQLYVENYKQADQTLTGTARKANLLSQSTKFASHASAPVAGFNRRVSTASMGGRGARHSSVGAIRAGDHGDSPFEDAAGEERLRRCITCGIDVSPKWWEAELHSTPIAFVRGVDGSIREGKLGGTPDGISQSNGQGIKQEFVNGEADVAPKQGDDVKDGLVEYQCHKCHWKMLHNPKAGPETSRDVSSPPRQSTAPPITAPPTWIGATEETLPGNLLHPQVHAAPNGAPMEAVPEVRRVPEVLPTAPAPIMPYAPVNGPSLGAPARPSNGSNGINGVAGPNMINGLNGTSHGYGHSLPGAAGLHYISGHEQLSGRHGPGLYMGGQGIAPPPPPPQQVSAPPSSMQGSAPHPPHPPQPIGDNARRSPQVIVTSPTYIPGASMDQGPQFAAARGGRENGYVGVQQAPAAAGQHGSPVASMRRPETPRDGSAEGRLPSNAGASASPSLRNLLH